MGGDSKQLETQREPHVYTNWTWEENNPENLQRPSSSNKRCPASSSSSFISQPVSWEPDAEFSLSSSN